MALISPSGANAAQFNLGREGSLRSKVVPIEGDRILPHMSNTEFAWNEGPFKHKGYLYSSNELITNLRHVDAGMYDSFLVAGQQHGQS